MDQNSFEFYWKIAVALSNMTSHVHMDPAEIQSVTVDDVEYFVGPFELIDDIESLFGESCWMFSFPETDFAVGMSSESWSSWGTHYNDDGNNFVVFRRTPKKSYDYEELYPESSNLDEMPYRRRW
jgi:hypothetical protein